ncbi:MAG: hypothetical protein ACFFC3_11910, partial [Candidatus Odinarchaeota archaeon]
MNNFRSFIEKFTLKCLVVSFATFILSVLYPLFIYIYNSSIIDKLGIINQNYIIRLRIITLCNIIIGISITGFIILSYVQKQYTFKRLIFSNLSIVLYSISIILSSGLVSFNINFDIFIISINLSAFYLFSIIIPILMILRNSYNFSI